MLELESQHPDVHTSYKLGKHVIRRSDRYWAGLSSDLVIEQVLMRSVKTTGGLTETQSIVWLLSMPACAEVNCALQDLIAVTYNTSDQHKEATRARQERDSKDTEELLKFLQIRNPFTDDRCLRSISTGVTADNEVIVDKANEIGSQILESMIEESILCYTFRSKQQTITLNDKTCVKFNEDVKVDSQLLFQLLLVVGERCDELPLVLKHELCSYPPALFEEPGMMRLANKSLLADAIWKLLGDHPQDPPNCEEVQYVLDGGSLKHRFTWHRGTTYSDICTQYITYVRRRYGIVTVVSTKDMTHKRRTRRCASTAVHFTSDMRLQIKKEEFLAKQILSKQLEIAGCCCFHANEDADLMIVKTALNSSNKI